MTAVSPMHARLILAARESGATDDDLHELVAEAIADAYFRREGGGRAGLHVEFKDIEHLDVSFSRTEFTTCDKPVYVSQSTIVVTKAGVLSPGPPGGEC